MQELSKNNIKKNNLDIIQNKVINLRNKKRIIQVLIQLYLKTKLKDIYLDSSTSDKNVAVIIDISKKIDFAVLDDEIKISFVISIIEELYETIGIAALKRIIPSNSEKLSEEDIIEKVGKHLSESVEKSKFEFDPEIYLEFDSISSFSEFVELVNRIFFIKLRGLYDESALLDSLNIKKILEVIDFFICIDTVNNFVKELEKETLKFLEKGGEK